MYTLSNNIKVFPSANRGNGIDAQSRLNTEFNLTNLINRLVDKKSFVITTNSEFTSAMEGTSGTDVPLEFNIAGYYFNILDMSGILSTDFGSSTSVYAHIQIGEYVDGDGYQELKPFNATTLDDEDNDVVQFYGLSLTDEATVTGGTADLLLLSRASTGADWGIPQSSRVKFFIDDGVLQ